MIHSFTHSWFSQNDPEQKFTLSFKANASSRCPLVSDIQIYQHRGDLFMDISASVSTVRTHVTAVSVMGCEFKFYIDIYISARGTEVLVIENVRTTIVNQSLQPCNFQDHP